MAGPQAWRIIGAEFSTAASRIASLPDIPLSAGGVPEVAFVGRSNVGKSSLLNSLCGQKSLARTSKTPGRTQQFNFFSVRFGKYDQEGARVAEQRAYFVDIPGFGYAQTSKTLRAAWAEMIEAYLSEREQLAAVCLLLDPRRDPGEEELWIADLGREGGLLPILTKCDKLSKNEQQTRKKVHAEALGLRPGDLLLSSSAPKKQRGLGEIVNRLAGSLFGIDG